MPSSMTPHCMYHQFEDVAAVMVSQALFAKS
jgi:hypothetical protein